MIDNNAFLDTIALLAAVAIGTLCLAYGLIIAIRALRNQISRRVIGYQLRRDAAYDYRATGILNSDLTVFFLNSGLRCIFPKVNVGAPWRDGLSQYLMDVDAFCDQMKAALELRGHVETKLTLENGFVTLSAKKLPHGFIRLRASLDHLEVSEEVNVALIKCDDSRVSALNHAAMQILGAADMALHKVFPHITPRSGETILMRTRNGHKKYCVYPVHEAEGIYAILPPSNAGLTQSDAAFSDNLPVPILHLSMDGELLQLNSLAEKVLLINEGEKLYLSDLLGGLGRPVDEWLRDAAFNRAPKTSEFLTVLRSESEAFVQVSLTKVDTLGEPQVLAVLSDATQFKALEAQFLQSQKMQAIGQLSGGVAHDFNNLITAISGHCELLLLNRDASDPDFNDLIQIRENSNRAAGLVRKLLAFSRKQTLQLERCDINRLVVDVTHLLNRLVGDDVRLTFETSRSLPLARLDKRQFEQVLVNLVVNARDAMPKGGTVVVSTERMHFTQPTRMGKATLSEGEYCIVKVRDEGSGIAENNLEKVFEPFFTTKPVGEGTGLGLSMVYGTIKQIGGFIFVSSERGVGTCFSIYLPADVMYEETDQKVSEPPAQSRALPAPPDQKGTILLVEDEASVRAFTSRALRLNGYDVIEASQADEALDIVRQSNHHIDIFITDIVMPGQSGPEWVRDALILRPEAKVIFVSGYTPDKLDVDIRGISEEEPVFLAKPFALSDIVKAVEGQMSRAVSHA